MRWLVVGIMLVGIALSGRIADAMWNDRVGLLSGVVKDPSPRLYQVFIVVLASSIIAFAIATAV